MSRAALHDVSPIVRKAFLEGLKEVQNRTGKTFSQIMADMIEADPVQAIAAVAKFVVKEKRIDQTTNTTVTVHHRGLAAGREFLQRITGQRVETSLSGSVQGEPVLPDPLRLEAPRH